MTYNVLIADDNKETVQSIQNLHFWQSLNCKVTDVAYNGESALQICDKKQIDIVVTDIKMPVSDGLDFSRKLFETKPDTIVILMSAFDEFTLVKKALELGVFSYILKPVNDEELFQTIKKALVTMNKNHELREYKPSEREIALSLSPKHKAAALKKEKEMLFNLITSCVKEQFDNADNNSVFYSQSSKYMLLVAGNANTHIQDMSNFHFLKMQVETICTYNFKNNIEYCICTSVDNKMYILLFFNTKTNKDVIEPNARELCDKIITATKGKCDVAFGISKVYTEANLFPMALNDTKFAYDMHYFDDANRVMFAEFLSDEIKSSQYTVMKKAYAVFSILKGTDGDIQKAVDDVFYDISLMKNHEVQNVKNMLICICSNVYQIYIDNTIFIDNNVELSDIFKKINNSKSLNECKKFVLALILNVYNKLQNKSTAAYSKIVADIIDYLNINYSKKLSLNDIADEFNFSAPHICRILKKETGNTFTGLFNEIKIKNAERLLHETDMKVYEIANCVGFENYAYFYQIYRKITGRNPRHN